MPTARTKRNLALSGVDANDAIDQGRLAQLQPEKFIHPSFSTAIAIRLTLLPFSQH
jgi:hypothetical protein